jgi:cytochrome c-type protein NapC
MNVARKRIFVIAAAGLAVLVAAVILVIGGAAGLAWTNTESFCIGCHEMRDNVYAEFKGTIHDTNRTGVRAICSDCHVPREPGALIKRKMRARSSSGDTSSAPSTRRRSSRRTARCSRSACGGG